MKKLIVLLFILHAVSAANARIISEGFDGLFLEEFLHKLVASHRTEIVKGEGAEGSNVLKVYYKGYERGSERVLASQISPKPLDAAELESYVKFCDDFKFVKKELHGVGPARPITGGAPITAEGWSARLMFTADGRLVTYVYYQDQKGKFGEL